MPDENGTDTNRPDAPSADDALFGDAADDMPTAAVEGKDSGAENAPEQQDAGEKVAGDEAPQEEQDAGEAGEPANDEAKATADDLKIVVSIKGGRAIIGVQRPSADPHIETFGDGDLTALAQEVPAVTERARARWEETPKHPAYERPAPPARRRNRRQQGTAEASNAQGEAEQEQQQELRLF